MRNTDVNVQEACEALVSKPLFATSAERFLILNEIKSKYNDLPQPLRFSRTLSELLSRVSTPVCEYDLIAGRCVDRELSAEEEIAFEEFCKHPDHPSRGSFMGSGHCTYSWETVLEKGIPGLRAEAMASLEKYGEDADKKVFLTAIIEIYDAIRDYMLRYAEAAQSVGALHAANALREATEGAPKSFAAALQLFWVITLIDCAYITENPTLTVGRMDVMLYPLYLADIDSGRMTEEEADAYITDYYCKHNLIMGRGEHQVGDESNSTTFKRICNFDAPQYLLLAGSDAQGNDCANELTLALARCIVPRFKNPVVVVRYTQDMDIKHPELWHVICEKALQSASMMIYNDVNVRATLERIGIPREESYNYAHFGCNWCSVGDDSAWIAGGPGSGNFGIEMNEQDRAISRKPYERCHAPHGWGEDFNIALRQLLDEGGEPTIDRLYDIFLGIMDEFVQNKISSRAAEVALRKRRPAGALTFGDCFFKRSVENGECFAAGAKYHFELQSFQMFGTVVDCFIAVDKLVIRDKRITLEELVRAVEADFVGYDRIRSLCLACEKYGSDTELSNYHVGRLSKAATDLVIERCRPYFEESKTFLMPCMQSDTWHLKYGETYGATPDGRAAHAPFSQNIRPSNGACVNGLTAMLNSIRQLPRDGLASGALNLDVDKRQFAGDAGIALFGALLGTYFNGGGLHAQISSLDKDDLLDAKTNPEAHRDLTVRITGYSGVFVDVCERLQNDIIERFN